MLLNNKHDISKQKIIRPLLIMMTVLVQIKSIFMDFDTDASYAVTMSYRHLRGDRLMEEMWEPHQTSTFLLDIILYIFRCFRHDDYTYVVLVLQCVSVIIYTCVVILFYVYVAKYVSSKTALLASVLLLIFRPKQLVLLEYSNMLVMFSLLLYLALMIYIEKKSLYSVLMIGILLCFLALVYPSAVIAGIPVLVIIIRHSENKKRDILTLIMTCVLAGGMYLGYFVYNYGLDGLIKRIKLILEAEGKHNTSTIFLGYKELVYALIWLAALSIVSYFISKLFKCRMIVVASAIAVVSDVVLSIRLDDISKTWKFCFEITFLIAVIYGLFVLGRKRKEQTWAVQSARILYILALADCISVRLLTNWAYITLCGYLILGVIGTILLNDERHGQDMTWIYALIILVGVHRLFVFTDYSMSSTLSMRVNTYVKAGPAKGIIATYIRPYQDKCDVEDFERYVNKGANLLIVSGGNLNGLDYMLQSSNVCVPSTISLPTYNETLLTYYDLHEDKVPEVIAVDCWYGNLNVSEDMWVMQWIKANYPNSIDGKYYRFYYK